MIGGGWAGIAAAVELVRMGRTPAVFESAAVLGGRARAVQLSLAGTPVELDNGQHLLLGAYRECLRIAGIVGADSAARFVRAPLRLDSTDGMRIAPGSLPAPLHLLGALIFARGLDTGEKLAMLRLFAGLRLSGWRARSGETVVQMLARYRQPESVRRRLWSPLVVAALNTPAEQACAATFARVLGDSLGAAPRASDFVLPARTLSHLMADPAEHWLRAQGATLCTRTTVRSLAVDRDRWSIGTSRGPFLARDAVLAVAPFAVARLLDRSALAPAQLETIAALERYAYESIATVYLGWRDSPEVALPPWIMLAEGDGAWGQWLFDRGTQNGVRIASIVVSARGRLAQVDSQELAGGICAQVAAQLGVPAPLDARTVVEKRATFRCTPDRPRIRPDALASVATAGSPYARLTLAGDYAYPDYPATLEAAMRAGVEAARLIGR